MEKVFNFIIDGKIVTVSDIDISSARKQANEVIEELKEGMKFKIEER